MIKINELNKKDMTYGSIIIALIITCGVGGVLIFEDNEGTTYYLSSNESVPKWQCLDPLMKSDCINGIKATGKRCYYDPNNNRKYKNCASLWFEIEQPKQGADNIWGQSYKIKQNKEPIKI